MTVLSRVFALSLLPALAATAQTTAQTAAPLLPPAGLHYRYWPMQMVQWVGPELPYSMIVLYADDSAKSYDVELIDRASGKPVHYVNTPELAAEDKAKGDDALVTRIQFDQPEAPGKGAQYGVRFNTEKGVPVVWQFVQGTDISEQGSGVSPVDAPFPVLVYREQGALAAEGTALKVGAVTSTAEMWKELAQPPYFVPYHAALSQGVHILSMSPHASTWVDAQPALTAGAAWKLTSAAGTVLNAHADAAGGAGATVSLTDAQRGVMTLDAQGGAGGWTVNRVRFGPAGAKADHTLSLAFTPAMAPGSDSRFELVAGRKTKLASGSVHTAVGEDGRTTETWTMVTGGGGKSKSAIASTGLEAGTAAITAK